MKQCIALAALVCLAAAGCAQTGLVGCGDGCGMGAPRRGRPLITRDASRPSSRLFGARGACDDGGCPIGAGFGACECSGCASGGPCQRLAEKVASGFCACPGGGICPNGGSYPENPNFQQGPPVGQVAYPYYTVRGPRDFLLDNPPHIGPR